MFIGAYYVPDIVLATEDVIVNKVLFLPSLHSSGGGGRIGNQLIKQNSNYRVCCL